MLLQGPKTRGQPQELYTDPQILEQLPAGSSLHLLESRHFWPAEAPDEMRRVLREFVPA